MQVLGPWSESHELARYGGGKSRGLGVLHAHGLRVPPWAVLGADIFDRFLIENGLSTLAQEFAAASDESDAQAVAGVLRDAIATAPMPESIAVIIAAAYADIGGGAVAVRSSMGAEDGAERSYAGQFDSFLNVTDVDDVIDKVRRCWISAFTPRSVTYAFAARSDVPSYVPVLSVSVPGVAVVVQRLVDAHASGVAFTVNPITGAADEVVLSAVYGLGEGLVSGAVDADTVIVDDRGEVIDRVIGGKETHYRPDGGGGAVALPVDGTLRDSAALTDAQIGELASVTREFAGRLGQPQDIEWALDDDGFWFLQTRPITAVPAPPALPVPEVSDADRIHELRGAGEQVGAGESRIWDNSNIIESFNGVTSPLTFSTAADIYGRVYRGYAESLRVPAAQLDQVAHWTPYLLGTFHGRVYYNLLHWYRMVGIAPGYPVNRKVLEAALGVSEPLADDIARNLRPFGFRTPWARLRSRAITSATYVHRLRHIDAIMDDFLDEFYRVYDEFEALDLDSMTGADAYAAYRRVDDDLVRRWGPLMVLDAILLTLTGSMFLLTKAFLPKAPEWFLYAVVGPGADVESAEPAQAMADLARAAADDPAVREILTTTAPDQASAALATAGHDTFLARVDEYLDRYGYRSLDELKLEVPDLREDPTSVYVMLRSAMARGDAPEPGTDSAAGESTVESTGESAGESAQDYLDAHLHGLRRRIYERVRSKTSTCAAHRERLRFCRTRAFGMIKRLIRVMGRDLVARGELDAFDDVFELTVEELRACFDTATNDSPAPLELRAIVAARRRLQARDAELTAPERFVTHGTDLDDAALAAQGFVAVADLPAASDGVVLQGTPSASGVVEGRAVVTAEPHSVDGGILVAYRTDPGWVSALPSASALIIERGSPLTHVAIVARELGVPTVVQLRDATTAIRTGMRLRVDGTRGTVTVISGGSSDADPH